MKLDDFRHQFTAPIRWGDEDSLGHLNNLVFMQFAEEGRVRYFHDVFPQEAMGGNGVILADIQCSFLKQVTWPAEITAGTRVARLGKSSAEALTGLYVADALVARVKSIIVWMNFTESRSEPWPEEIKAAVRKFEKIPVE